MERLDTNLYSRQISTYGLETMKKLQNLKVFIIGMRGIGIEVAKNLILAGPKEVQIYDKTKCIINDLGSNFYLSEDDLGKRRDYACLKKLRELNSYVSVNVCQDNYFDSIKYFNAIIITEIMKTETLFRINDECRKYKISFIYALSFGISGFIFNDFGNEHIVNYSKFENKKSYFIKSITNDGTIEIDDEQERNKLSLSNGKYVIFKEVGGIEELNNLNPKKIKNISNNKFSIEETFNWQNYTNGGIVEEFFFPKKIEFKKLKDLFYEPYENNKPKNNFYYIDEGRDELLHCAFIAIHEFFDEYDNLPNINDKKDYENVLGKSKSIYNKGKINKQNWIKKIKQFDEQIIINVARWSRCEISPFCSFLGGMISQEVIKITGKYAPINQWFWVDFFESVENLNNDINRELEGKRYDDQIAIYGRNAQEMLGNLNVFIVGAGALGCELLKILSLMGISKNKDKKTIVTDNDRIEISNLNRQFLFRKQDINKSKSIIAAEEAKKMNDEFNCEALELLVNEDTEKIFNEDFWVKQNFILTAVDNREARKYIDTQCTKYSIPLIDSGTLGTRASCQIIFPFKTSCYNDNKQKIEKSIPLCTLRNFPSKIEHCIEWGLSKFNDYFINEISNFKKYIEEQDKFFTDLERAETDADKIEILKSTIQLKKILKENSYDKIIEYSIEIFCNDFDFQIQKLIKEIPKDSKNKDNTLFWVGSKKFPHPITFDVNDSLCLEFVNIFSHILLKVLDIKCNEDINYIKKFAKKIILPIYKDTKEQNLDIESFKHQLIKIDLKNVKNIITPEIFQKDDDSNHQIDFINICANLRAKNYDIEGCEKEKTKMIAGRIVPAIATTTSAITGFVCLQLYTLLNTNGFPNARCCNLDLAYGTFEKYEPAEPLEKHDEEYDSLLSCPTKAVPPRWTIWDHIEVKGPMSCKEFIDYFKEKYKVEIMSISCQSYSIIRVFMPNSKNKISLSIEEIYKQNNELDNKINHLWLEIFGYIDNICASMPRIKYIFN